MAILPMKRIHIYGLLKDRKQILELLQRFGTVQVEDDLREDHVFQKRDIAGEKAKMDREISMVSDALDILKNHVPEDKSIMNALKGREELSFDLYQDLGARHEELMRAAAQIRELDRQIAETTALVHKLQVQMDALTPWSKLDIPLQFQGTRSTYAIIGTLPGEVSKSDILVGLFDLFPEAEGVHVDIVSSFKDQTCIFVLCHRKAGVAVEGALRSMGFARPSVSSDEEVPAKRLTDLKKEYQAKQQEIQTAKAEIVTMAEKRKELQFLEDWLYLRTERLNTTGLLLESKRTFIISGYVPEREAEALTKALTQDCLLYLELKDPTTEDEVPILLENHKFFEPVDGVLRSFSYPGKGEIDPTAIMSIFYYVLFGLMLSDAAYGLIMALGCGIFLWKFPNMETGMKKSLRMFFLCGLATVFWGALFGSWFGDAVTVISATFFNKPVIISPLWFEPVKDPMRMLVFSMAVGVIHLFAGLAANIVQSIRKKEYMNILYDAIFWYLLVGGLIVLALSSPKFVEILNLNFLIPANIGKIAGLFAAVSAFGIILTAGRESKNWFKRIAKGLYGLYNVTGYLSDILSYSRLLALGLATGVIATVINQMGAMGGRSITGAILFVVVFLFGHAINIGINLLGAYVHTNRLSFVEFFGKFYEGGGSEFTPLGVHTKYFKIKEDTHHG